MILSVRQDKKERKRYHLYAESETLLLTVHEDILIKHRLMKGAELSMEQLEEIRTEDERYRAYALAVYYLGFKPRTRKQIHHYLSRKELEEDNIMFALDRLEKEHLVDDEQYARQFAAGRLKNGLKGRLWIKQELKQRGVSKQASAEAADALDRKLELAAAEKAAEKKWRSLKGETADRKRKLMGYLLRRGFPGDIVREAVKLVVSSGEADSSDEDDGLLLDN
ncbi:RecX family transcriptional regulator [Paenibacillus sp. IB182493]|uniref:Regulatory protein RecX n=1 Tax=Paenibacillus arenilitoris TaxID=2772299 RepID=A0A927H749_9BACL|nr:RecX family transcriptional regulator [Paenibacillus arenilitoris]